MTLNFDPVDCYNPSIILYHFLFKLKNQGMIMISSTRKEQRKDPFVLK